MELNEYEPSAVNVSVVYPRRLVTQLENPTLPFQYAQQQIAQPAPIAMPYVPIVQAEAVGLPQQVLPCGCVTYLQPAPIYRTFIGPLQLVQPGAMFYRLPYQVLGLPRLSPPQQPQRQVFATYQQPIPAAPLQQLATQYGEINTSGPNSRPVAMAYPTIQWES